MIHLDTNFLIGAMAAGSPQDRQLREWAAAGEVVSIDASDCNWPDSLS